MGSRRAGEILFRPFTTRLTQTVTWGDATEAGEMLWRANWEATENGDPTAEMPAYRFERYPGEPDPVVVLKSIAHYRYRTADEPEWYDVSPAAGFMSSLQDAAIDRLAGFDRASWGIYDRTAFLPG